MVRVTRRTALPFFGALPLRPARAFVERQTNKEPIRIKTKERTSLNRAGCVPQSELYVFGRLSDYYMACTHASHD